MTGTSSKSPMSGTFTSRVTSSAPSQVGEHGRQVRREARGERAVDDAVVVGERQRDHQPRHELAAVPDRLHRRARDAEDRDLGRVDDRREARAADAAERRDRERRRPACPPGPSLPSRALPESSVSSLGDVEEALLSTSLITGTTRPLRRVGREAEVVVALEHQLVAVERGVELGKRCSAGDERLQQQRDHRQLHALLGVSSFVRLRNASSSVMSASSLCVTCGIVTQLRRSSGPRSA